MKNSRLISKLVLMTISFSLFSCHEDDYLNKRSLEGNFISQEDAQYLSSNIVFNESSSKRKQEDKEIQSITPVPDENNNTVYYIINYENGGFIIFSADNRKEPILAYSETNNFNLDFDHFPSGLVTWLANTKDEIKYIRKNKLKQTEKIMKLWDMFYVKRVNLEGIVPDKKNSSKRIEPPTEPDCTTYVIIYGPYLSTTWNQRCGFNDFLGVMNSCNELNCDYSNVYVGCVPIALAQIMRYYQYPNRYSWSSMANNSGSTATAFLIKDIHNALGDAISYHCTGTGVSRNYDKGAFLRNSFNYTSASQADYNYQTVKNELKYGRPVLLTGGHNDGWWIFNGYADGHAWVANGSREIIDPCYGSYLHFYMNWGWGGLYDGWYGLSDFTPGDNDYNYKNKMVYNIKP